MWPCNFEAFELLLAGATQWRFGPLGPAALDYPALFQVAGVLGIEVDQDMLLSIQAVEAAQLRMWRKARKNQDQ